MFKKLFFSLSGKFSMMFCQMFLGVFIARLYGVQLAGSYGVVQGISTMILMAALMAMPKLVAVRFASYSTYFFTSASLFAVFLSAAIYAFAIILIGDFSLFAIVVFWLKAVDALGEVNAVYHRRFGREKYYSVLSFVKLIAFACWCFLVFVIKGSVLLFLIGLLFLWLVFLFLDYRILGIRFLTLPNCWGCYKKLSRRAYQNSISALISTGLTVSPRYAVSIFIGEYAAGVYLLVSYIYTSFVTFFSIVLQTIVSGYKDIVVEKKVVFKRVTCFLLFYYGFAFGFLLLFYSFLEEKFFGFSTVGSDHYLIYLLMSAAVLLSMRDFYGYFFLKKAKFWSLSGSGLFALVIFWSFAFIFNYDASLLMIGGFFLASIASSFLMFNYAFRGLSRE